MAKKPNKGAAVLKRITNRAKKIRAYSGGSWAAAVKKAGAEYRGDKKHKVVKKKFTSKKKHKTVGSTSVGKDRVDRKRVNVTIGGMTAARAKSMVKNAATNKLKNALYQRDQATTKTARKKIAKRITVYRREIKMFS